MTALSEDGEGGVHAPYLRTSTSDFVGGNVHIRRQEHVRRMIKRNPGSLFQGLAFDGGRCLVGRCTSIRPTDSDLTCTIAPRFEFLRHKTFSCPNSSTHVDTYHRRQL